MPTDAENLVTSLLDRAGIRVDGDGPDDIRVHDTRLWERLVRDRELGLGESYMDGWWDAEHLDRVIARILASDIRSAIRPSIRLIATTARTLVANRQTRGRAHRNAAHHYDIGNDLYEAMLDRRMTYSCGYWRGGATDLDAAQEAKLDLICRKLHLEPGMRLLDIGCGWGSLVQFAAERYGVEAVGVTPAAEQVDWARAHVTAPGTAIMRADYREVTGRFDRIVSVGMMEHVGPRNLGAFFGACDRLLTADGVMLHHMIGSPRTKGYTNPWIDRYIFPGGVLPSLAQIGRGAEPGWVAEDLQNIGTDYDPTLMTWHARIEAAWHRLPRYDERFRRMWRFYLLSCAGAFRVRELQVFQTVFRRRGPAEPYAPVR